LRRGHPRPPRCGVWGSVAAPLRYVAAVPPCFDVYVWIQPEDRAGVLSRFIDAYVDMHDPGDPRFDAFVRTFVEQARREFDSDTAVGTMSIAHSRRDVC
jgi:hypothetical protein